MIKRQVRHLQPSVITTDLPPDSSHSRSPMTDLQRNAKRKHLSSEADGMSRVWTTPGMDTFVDWVTDPDNYARVYAHQPLPHSRPIDIHKETAKLVNKKYGTAWDAVAVKSRIAYSKKKYDAARKLTEATGAGDTEEIKLREVILDECPFYEDSIQSSSAA